MRTLTLSDFDELASSTTSVTWLSDIPTSAVGGVAVHQFPQPGVYPVIFVVRGNMTRNGTEESVRVEENITVSRRLTLQVQHVNHCRIIAVRLLYYRCPT